MRETQFGSRGAGKPRTFPLKRLNSQPRRREVRVCFWQLRFKRGKGGPGAAPGASGPLGRSEPGPRGGRVRPRALPASRARIVSLCPAWGVSWSRRW